jgi:ParB-like chromosome segregation protein Spo0J
MTDLTPNGKTHPVAELFPILSDEELNELAADIKTNGLIFPVVLDEKGTLIDGRMRMEACQRAEIEPKYIRLERQDAVSSMRICSLRKH